MGGEVCGCGCLGEGKEGVWREGWERQKDVGEASVWGCPPMPIGVGELACWLVRWWWWWPPACLTAPPSSPVSLLYSP